MRSKMEWAAEIRDCLGRDPETLQRVIAAIQADAARAGFEQAIASAADVVKRSRTQMDRKLKIL